MSYSTLLFDVAGGVATITINRPDKLNALNATVIDELEHAFRQVASEQAIKGVLLTGSGEKAFVAGADIQQFTDLDPSSARTFALRGQEVFNAIEQCPKPVVAAVNGYALGGGCELAMACHLRVASDKAIFGQPEVNLGIIPGYGGTQRLPRLVGRGIALEMILTGDHVTAQRAYEIGLVNKVRPQDELQDGALDFLGRILSKGPVAVRLSLEAVRASDLPLIQAQLYEAALFGQSCATEDQKEGAKAFLERRKPVFKGQ
jgi:enoyl-CoA hydratase